MVVCVKVPSGCSAVSTSVASSSSSYDIKLNRDTIVKISLENNLKMISSDKSQSIDTTLLTIGTLMWTLVKSKKRKSILLGKAIDKSDKIPKTDSLQNNTKDFETTPVEINTENGVLSI